MKADELLVKVNDFLDHLQYNRKPEGLYAPVKYVLSMGGKRIRPILLLLAYNLYKDNPESVLMQACALETYHNYTLLHDDLMDNAEMRRGHETVHKRWDANTAILSGDSMLVLAYERMAKCREVYLEIGEGQQYDMDFETRNGVTEAEYIEMIRLKTSVLLACAMKIGAILADAPKQDQENLYKFGEQIGLAFQLQDDYLDVYGDPKVFGKKIGGEIISNKKTYMLINAFNRADAELRRELVHWIEAKTFDCDEKVAAVTAIYNKVGVDKLASEKIACYFQASKKYLDAVQVGEDRKAELRLYARKMMEREY